jgi:hypothetical protein
MELSSNLAIRPIISIRQRETRACINKMPKLDDDLAAIVSSVNLFYFIIHYIQMRLVGTK